MKYMAWTGGQMAGEGQVLERQTRSNGSRQACGAISWWMAFGPHDPGAYERTGEGLLSRP